MADEAAKSVEFPNIELNRVDLPSTIEIRESSIIKGQPGAFSTAVIHKDTRYGPYKGEIINAGQKRFIDYRFAWEVFEGDSNVLKHTISSMDSKTSNWMRHVNCARFYEEQNILSVQDGYSIFYVAMKDIKPEEELLTWFDPKLLKRTKRRLSKMKRKPVGYTIELVPWADEKKFVPEIIETKRPRKKKILSDDMISLDEDPLAITRMLQRLPKLPNTSKQLKSCTTRASVSYNKNDTFKTSSHVSKDALSMQSTKKESKPSKVDVFKITQPTERKMTDMYLSNPEKDINIAHQDGTIKKEILESQKSLCAHFEMPSIKAEQGHLYPKTNASNLKNGQTQMFLPNKKVPMKSGISELHQTNNSALATVKPVVIKPYDNGSTYVEDHDEMYILRNIDLRPECDDKCPCHDPKKLVKPCFSDKQMNSSFVTYFTLLPEHKTLSPDNKIIFKCDVCDSAYNHVFSLKRHYLGVHVNHRYLSKDDIVNCQLETFHTDIQLHNKSPGIKMRSEMQSQEPSPVVERLQSSPVKLLETDGNKPDISQVCISELPAQSNSECKKTLKGEESQFDISGEVTMTHVVQILSTVPSLSSLAQISVDKAMSRLSLYTCEETNNMKATESISLECDESLDLELLSPLESETTCHSPEKQMELESTGISQLVYNKQEQDDVLSGLDEYADCQNVTAHNSADKKCNSFPKEQHIYEDNAVSGTIEEADIMNPVSQALNSLTSDIFGQCYSDETPEKSQSGLSFNMSHKDLHCKTLGNLSHIDHCKATDTCENLQEEKITESSTDNMYRLEILPEKELAANTDTDSNICCASKINGQSKIAKNQQETLSCNIINRHEQIKNNSSVTTAIKVTIEAAAGLHEDRPEDVINSQVVCVPASSINSLKLTDVVNMDGESNRISVISDQTFQEAKEVISSFPECVKIGQSNDMEVEYVTSGKVVSVSNNLPLVSTTEFSDKASSTDIKDSAIVNNLAVMESSDSFSTNYTKACDEKQGKSDQQTLQHANLLSISVPKICAESTGNQNQSCQKLIFVTNIVFPVATSPNNKFQNSLSSQLSVPHVLSQVTHQTSVTRQIDNAPAVLISQKDASITQSSSTDLETITSLLTTTVAEKAISDLDSCPVSSRTESSDLGCRNTSSENQCTTPERVDITLPPSSSMLSEQISCQPIIDRNTESTLPLIAISSQGCGPHLSPCNPEFSQKVESSNTFTSPTSNTFSQINNQPDDLYRCHMCVLLFKTVTELKLHIKNDPHRFKGGIKQYACQQCSLRFSNKNNLLRHNLVNHPESENYQFRCFTCGKGFTSETYLKMHARFHTGKNFPCKYGCVDAFFPNAASLVKHLRTHHAGLNLKEYLKNVQDEKAQKKGMKHIFVLIDGHTTIGGVKRNASETAVASIAPCNSNLPDMEFQVKRGHPKVSKNTHKHDKEIFPKIEDKMIKQVKSEEEPCIIDEKNMMQNFKCNKCPIAFMSHIKLLQHRTLMHGADQSVQEYLHEMSKEMDDDGISDADAVKLVFSPPPSPKTFFENVNRKGVENMSSYIDGSSESLQSCHKHLSCKLSYSERDPVLSLKSEKLEWTMFNFPPCFQYREDCTAFYDNILKSSQTSLGEITRDRQEKDQSCDSYNVQSDFLVDSMHDSVRLHETDQEIPVAVGKDSLLLSYNRNLKVEENDPTTHSFSGDISLNKLHLNSENILQKRNMDAMTGREVTAGSYKNKIAFNSDMMNCKEHILTSDSKLEDLSCNADVCCYEGNHEHRVEVCDDFTGDNESLCKSVQNESTSNGNTMTINTQPPLRLGDLVKISKIDKTSETNTISADCVAHPDVTEDGIDIKDQSSTSSISCELYTTKVDQNFRSSSLSENFQALQNRFFEVMDLETLQGSFLGCNKKLHYNLDEKDKSHSDFMCQKSVLLIDALDLQTCGVSLSRKLLMQMTTDNRLVLSTRFRQKCELFESSVTALQSKQSHNSVLVASDLSKHEHKRYSIWTGQINQKFESSSKEDIFCQPVTDALRKFKAMQQQAEYDIEKSVRDKEMQEKQHHRTTQKISFAETLGLMTRIDFELSFHVEKEKECTIKAPEVWENYENIWFGKRGNITVVCSICHRHFSCWDLCFRHQLKKHPHLEPASLEMERENYIEDMYYYYPMPYGILAQTQLIPNNLPAPEVYVCTKCAFPFRNLSRLHAHIIICDPTRQVTTFNQIDNLKKPNYMKKKLIPMMNRHSNQSIKSVEPVKKYTSTTSAVIRDTDKKSCSANVKKHSPRLLTLNNKLSSSLQSRSVFSAPFSVYSNKQQENYNLYNPQKHARRRELYKVLDQHQCHGCNLKFRSLFMLERHVRSCSGRDKLQNQKPLLSGIISDDAVLRKQHTCRYCTKRFTHIKGVDLHYKRICAVRKVKEEENQLTQEDLAHESELKRIIEHVKWSKSLNKDSSDIIQGHVRVEEDGSLTCLSKKHGCQNGLKKKIKKKGFKWTSLKRHRTDENYCTSPVTSTENIPFLMKKEKRNVDSLKKKKRQNNTKGNTLKRSKNSVTNIPSESIIPTKARNLAMKQPTRKRDRPKRFDPSEMESSYKKKKKYDEVSSSSQINTTRAKYDSSGRRGAYYDISLRSSNQKRERADVSPKGRHLLKNKSENNLLKTISHTDIEAITCREEKIYGKAAQNIESNKLFAKMRKLKEAAKLEMRKSSHFKKVSRSFRDVLHKNSVNYKKTDVGENKDKKCFKPSDNNSSSSELLKQLTKDKELLHRQKKLSQGTNFKRKRSELAELAGMLSEGQWVPAKKFKKSASSTCLTVPISMKANSPKMSGSSTLQKTPALKLGKNKMNAKSLSAETVTSSITLNRESNMIKINASDKRSSSLKCASSTHKQSSVSVRVVTLSPNGNNLQTCDSSSDITLLPSTFSTKPGQITTNLTHSPESISCSLTQEGSQLTKSPAYTQSSTCKNMEVVNIINFSHDHLGVDVDKTSSVSHVCKDSYMTSDEILQGQNSPPDVIYQYENEQLIIGDSNNYELENQFSGHPQEVGVKKFVKNYPPKSSVVWVKNVEDYSQPSSVIGTPGVNSTAQLSPRSSMKETGVHIAENKAVLLSNNGHIQDKTTSIPTAKIDQRASTSNGPTGNIVHILSGVPSQSSHIKIMKNDADKSKLNSKQQRFGHARPVVPSTIASSDISMAQPVHLSASCMTNSKYTDEKIKNSLSAIIVPSTLASTQMTSQKKASISTSTKQTTIPTRLESPVKLVTLRCTVIPTSAQGNKVHTDTRTVQQRNITQTYTQTKFNEQLNQRPTLSQTNPMIIAQMPSCINVGQLPRHATRDALYCQNTQQTVMQNTLVQSLDQANVSAPYRKPSTHSLLNHNSTSKPILHNPVAAAPQQSLLNSVSFSLVNSKGVGKSVSLVNNKVPSNKVSLVNSKVANHTTSLINKKEASSSVSLVNSKVPSSNVSLVSSKVANHTTSLINNKVPSSSVSLVNNKVASDSVSLINSKDANNPAEESLLSVYSDIPVTNHIMVTLDDGTTALMDPDSLAQLLTFSPSFFEPNSIVSHSNIVSEENITDTVQTALEEHNRDGDVTAKEIGS